MACSGALRVTVRTLHATRNLGMVRDQRTARLARDGAGDAGLLRARFGVDDRRCDFAERRFFVAVARLRLGRRTVMRMLPRHDSAPQRQA